MLSALIASSQGSRQERYYRTDTEQRAGDNSSSGKRQKTFLKFTCAHRSKLAVTHSVEQLLKLIAVFPIIVFKAILNFSKSSTLPSLYYIKYALWGTEGVVGHFQALVPCEKTVPSPVTLVRTW